MSTRTAWLGILGAVIFGVALRVVGLWSDFWLDEIWTSRLAARIDSALAVFTDIHTG